jgi:hypothetical protein
MGVNRRSLLAATAGLAIPSYASARTYPSELTVGAGAPAGSNVQIGSCHYASAFDWTILKSPNQSWVCTLDCNTWKLWNAGDHPEGLRHKFMLRLNSPDQVVLDPNGAILIYSKPPSDNTARILFQVGPFGPSSSYQLKCEDEGDLVLYDGNGTAVWHAVGNLPNPPGYN